MNPRLSDYAVCAVLSLAQAILVFVILKKGAARRWPFLLLLCLFDLTENALLVTHLGRAHYRQYFYIYWTSVEIRALLSLGLLWDVTRALPALRFVPKHIGLMLASFGLTVTGVAVCLTLQHHPNIVFVDSAHALMVRECVAVAWMCFALSLLGSISFLGLGWSLEAVNVTAGFVASGMIAMLAASLTSSWPQHGQMIDKLQTCIEIAVIFFWAKTLNRPLPDALVSDSALNAIQRAL